MIAAAAGRIFVRFGLAAGLVTALAAPAIGQSLKSLGDFRDWSAYSATQEGGDICFAMTKPKDVSPMPPGYAQAYLYLTDRPAEGITDEMNLIAGFTFQPNSQAMLTVGDQSFSLFTQNDGAWLADPSQSEILAGAIRAGTRLTVTGTSQRGASITETFSLFGATAATRAADAAC